METNCKNCGATLALEHFADRLACNYCGTLHMPSIREDADIRVVEGPPAAVACPVCQDPLANAAIGEWTFHFCSRCRGLLLFGEDLLNVIVYARRDSAEPFRDPEPIDPAELERSLKCPDCEAAMSAHAYYGPGDIVIDSCASCDRVWLDGGELGRTATVKWGGSLWR